MPQISYGDIQAFFFLFILICSCINITLGILFSSTKENKTQTDFTQDAFQTSYPWPPIKIYAYPNNSHHPHHPLRRRHYRRPSAADYPL